MQISDLDIHRAAHLLIKQHGEAGAETHAQERIVDMQCAEDEEGVGVWKRILVAIDTLSKPASEAKN